MMRLLHIVLPSIAAYCFWQWVSFAHLPLTLSQMTSALSIFIAAVLVRLARGMPTLDWKTVPIEKRKVLTGQLVDVSREYAGLLALLMLLLIMAVSIGTTSVWLASLDEKWGRLVSAATGFLVVLSILRFGYVVWRDLDIVSLQKVVIDEMADQERAVKNAEIASGKLQQMRQANLSGGPGSTLIAAEKNGIDAFVMEFDPKFADVIITRWQDFTGQTATLESTGQAFGELKAERVAE